MLQRFNGEFRIDLDKNSTLLIRKAQFHTEFPLGLNLNTSSVTVDQVDFRGGITTTPTGKCRMTVSKANAIGEFIVAPDFDLFCADSDDLFFWMALGSNFQGKLTLPAGKVMKEWTSGHQLNLRVKNCNKVHWCILSTERGNGSVEGIDLYACGLIFGGQSSVALKELHNKRPLENFTLGVTDRTLRFKDSAVSSWTFYVNEKAHLTVDRCTFGEALAFGNGRIVIRDSTCDGTGGFIGAVQDSEIRMTNCTITCLVLAKGKATIILQNCKVTGDVRATENGTVRLIGCEVKGNVSKDPGATLIRD